MLLKFAENEFKQIKIMAIRCSWFATPNLCKESSKHRLHISELICCYLGEHCSKYVITKRINGATQSQYELFFLANERYSGEWFRISKIILMDVLTEHCTHNTHLHNPLGWAWRLELAGNVVYWDNLKPYIYLTIQRSLYTLLTSAWHGIEKICVIVDTPK